MGLALLRLEAVAGGALSAGDTLIHPVTPDWMQLPE
jgi:hypothetical protein